MNNINIFNKINKLEEEFSPENKNLVKKIFNQIKLSNRNIKNKLYRSDNFNREIKINNYNNCKETDFYLNDFVNEEAAFRVKNNNSVNLKQLILRNIDKIKFKGSNKNPNWLIPNIGIETNWKSDERDLIKNEHIINNCASVNLKNETLKKRNFTYTDEESNIMTKDDKGIINKDYGTEKDKNCRNSKNREDYKNFLVKDNTKLRKNISSMLNKQEDLYNYLEKKLCPIISDNFEMEKNRVNKIAVLSANTNKRTYFNIRKNSSINKKAASNNQININKGYIDEKIKNIQEENRLIGRKFKTANNPNKRNSNIKNANNIDDEKTYKNNNNLLFNNTSEKNFIYKIKRINRRESQDKNNILFLTNINKAKRETEIEIKRNIFTPDVNNQRLNNNRIEVNFHENFPTRNIIKIKSDGNFIKNKNMSNSKNADFYYKNRKKIQVFESVKDQKIPLQKKNIYRNFEINSECTNYELTNKDSEKEITSKNEFNSLFKSKEQKIHNPKRILENSDLKYREDRKKSFIDCLIIQTNSNKKVYSNELPKREVINFVADNIIKTNNIIDNTNNYNNNSNKIKIHTKRSEFSPKYSENKEHNKFDIIENEFNFSRMSSENRDENFIDYEPVLTSSKNLNNYKIKSNFDRYEAFSSKENLNFNVNFKDYFNKKRQNHMYSYSKNNVFNSSIPRISVANKSASNFHSKNKIFSYIKDDKLRNTINYLRSDNIKFAGSLNVKKVQFFYDEKSDKAKMSDLFNNNLLHKTTVIHKIK